MTKNYQWSPGQLDALFRAQAWIHRPQGQQIFRIWGWAGTGKTTLAQTLASDVRGSVVYGAFTGKAALVMRSRGCEGASTLHSLLYHSRVNPATGEVIWERNRDSPIKNAQLVVVDEVSMVNDELAQELIQWGRPILVLGDPAQLPPISGQANTLTGPTPDIELTEIHRQALNSPVTQIAHRVRTGEILRPGVWGDSTIIPRRLLTDDQLDQVLLEADQVLVGRNATRIQLNQRIRRARGLTSTPEWMPVPGDQLVCTRNSRQYNLINGGQWWVKSATSAKNGLINLSLVSDDQYQTEEDFRVPREYFQGTESTLDPKKRSQYPEFTWGWALTTHKAQGSQWPHVVVMDESGAFRENQNRWLYTAVTRASERVTLIQ